MKRLIFAFCTVFCMTGILHAQQPGSPIGGMTRNPVFDSVVIGTANPLSITGNYTTGFPKITTSGGSGTISTQAPTSHSVIASGTVATLSNSAPSAALDFGTQDPDVVLGAAGTYLIAYTVQPALAAATFAAEQSATFRLYRINNTPADLTATYRSCFIPICTTATANLSAVTYVGFYTTATEGDELQIRGQLSAAAGAGSVTATAANITAVMLFQ